MKLYELIVGIDLVEYIPEELGDTAKWVALGEVQGVKDFPQAVGSSGRFQMTEKPIQGPVVVESEDDGRKERYNGNTSTDENR